MDEELLQRQAPQALEAEQSVLGSMLIDERCVPDVVGMLQPDDFYLRQNREIYETIYTMFNFSEKIDPVTVLNKMKERGVYDEQRSYDYIAQLLKITPTAANVKQYCTIVHDKSRCARLATASSEITEMVYDGVGTAHGNARGFGEKDLFAPARQHRRQPAAYRQGHDQRLRPGWKSWRPPAARSPVCLPDFTILTARSTA